MTNQTAMCDSLKRMALFSEFTPGELETLVDLVEPKTLPAGTLIVKQDEPGDCMYIIVDGSAKVIHRAKGKEFLLATLSRGQFFGEIALVDEGPRSADVIAVEPCTVLALEQSVIRALAGVYPSAAFKMLVAVGRTLIERMRQGNKKYIDSLLLAADTQ
jgi:CRP/FNR family transcriptional regulator, cyclic AMP receptor protein